MAIPRNLSNLAQGANTSGVLGVSKGGTGLSTPGTSGNILTSDGTAWVSSAPAAGGFSTMAVFTSSGTFTIPSGKTMIKITAVGGGGSGGSNSNTSQRGCGGGGGGGLAVKYLTVTPGQNLTYTVGAGGTAPSAGTNADGNTGGTTTVVYNGVNVAVATGGLGGGSSNAPGGSGGIGTTGDLLLAGNGGEACSTDSGGGSQGGLGGGSPLGGGAAGSSYGQPSPINGRNYGGGGTGGFLGSTVGAGGNGVVIVEY